MKNGSVTVGLLVAASLVGACTPNFSGEYDGHAKLDFGATNPELKSSYASSFPVHVSVSKTAVDITGGPLSGCHPAVTEASSRGMILSFNGGVCAMKAGGKTYPLADGAAIATLEGKKLTMSFNGKDTLSFDATMK